MAFVPRLSTTDPTEMMNNIWWYSEGNPYYVSGWGLPNCTCYSYGRVGEINNQFTPLPITDAGLWWEHFVDESRKGQTPALGSVICYGGTGSTPSGQAGHCAVVEEIYDDGSILISESGYDAFYFTTERVYQSNGYLSPWMQLPEYDLFFQGFLYVAEDQPIPPQPSKRKRMPVWMMLKYGI